MTLYRACGQCPPERYLGDAETAKLLKMTDGQTGSERLRIRDAVCVAKIRA
jgi:hypothetical protein